MSLKVAVAQLNPKIGAFSKQIEKAQQAVAQAKKQGATLLVFPELYTTGYPPRDLLNYDSFVQGNLDALKAITKLSSDITIVVGFVEPNPSKVGKPFFNSAALIRNKKIEAVYRKTLLPYYNIFDEERYFEAGDHHLLVFEQDKVRFAVSICEEIWNHTDHLHRPYEHDPLTVLKKRKVDVLLNLSASPFHVGKPADRTQMLCQIAKKNKVAVVYCSQVGANDEILFDGGSVIVSAKGEVLALAPAFEEALLVNDVKTPGKIAKLPKKREAWIAMALEMGLRDYAKKTGVARVILGLSGGIDSAVAACIAVRALGEANVLGILLPTRFTSNASLKDAIELGGRLGIETQTISIEPVLAQYERQWLESEGQPLVGVSHENLQPRIRMTWLMAMANKGNRLLLNTSNKSEIAMGYATLYGDSAGALALLGDLVKDDVYRLARYYNVGEVLIPPSILERPPTAELRPNQKDQDSLPPYPVLDKQVQKVVEEGVMPPAKGKDWETFYRLYGASEYKRRQLPPALRVTSQAFGTGRRMPIAAVPFKG